MITVKEIEAEVLQLPAEDAVQLMEWLSDYLENQAELTPQFIASIERGQADLRDGCVRIRQP